ncbi:probable serine/threonine-protein kinase roco9 [Leguminivora glycinivorella]|uniref:probable serine/threonine-protein kinase roco9 n=1 Tax=Leguminivora glycinivorella TaxID=1035111 RepID=UPI00201019CF|nr:probable serine/threonine-protein kinase roco9 [Leguminivora glycinivorella]
MSLLGRGDLIADPDVLRRLKPMQVRITKCDGLLVREIGDHYDVSRVKPNYGLAKNYIYPYMKLPPVKSEPLYRNSMVAIPLALKEELSFTHWDSDSDVEETIIKTVPSLTTLTIKKLFSKNLLGKVPRKRKKVKNETFDNEEFGDVSKDINDIINSLDDRGNGRLDSNLTARIKDIIGCLDDDVGESVDTANEQSELDVNDKTIDNDNIGEKDKTISKSEDQPDTPNDIEADKTVADENQAEDEAVTNEYCNKTDIDNNKNDESTKGDEMESNSNAEKSSTDVNVGENNINNVLESNQINDVVNESEIINRVDSGTNDHSDNFNKEDISLQKSKEDENIALDSMDLDNVAINGINTHSNGNSFDNDSKLNEDESCPGKDSKNNDDDTILSNDNSFDNGSKLNEDESCPGKDSKNNDDDTRLSNDNSFDNGSKLNENDTSLESDSKIIDDSRKISNDKSFDNDSKLKENECSPEKTLKSMMMARDY